MAVTGYHRGHEMRYEDGAWRYTVTGQLVAVNPEPDCGACGEKVTPEGHDGCLGTLPGVVNACCGHGVEAEAYVSLADGRLGGAAAVAWIAGVVAF